MQAALAMQVASSNGSDASSPRPQLSTPSTHRSYTSSRHGLLQCTVAAEIAAHPGTQVLQQHLLGCCYLIETSWLQMYSPQTTSS